MRLFPPLHSRRIVVGGTQYNVNVEQAIDDISRISETSAPNADDGQKFAGNSELLTEEQVEEEDYLDADDTDDEDEEIAYVAPCNRGFSPPTPYLPLPSTVIIGEPDEAMSDEYHACGVQLITRHPVPLASLESLDNYRKHAYMAYEWLPRSQSGLPVLARIRRRLLRLAGHVCFAHHRGRHEVIFQTSFLFDLVLAEYSKWVNDQQADVCPSITDFMRDKSGTSLRRIGKTAEALSRMTTTASVTTRDTTPINYGDGITKEDLRTLAVTSLLLASKWNNSRHLPPSVLCSAPIGRVPLSSVLQMEVDILSLFDFDIPFQNSLMDSLNVGSIIRLRETFKFQLICGFTEEDIRNRSENPLHLSRKAELIYDLAAMTLVLSLGDYRSLKIKGIVLVYAALHIAEELAETACGGGPDQRLKFTTDGFLTTEDEWKEAVKFLVQLLNFEVTDAVAAIPRFQDDRWNLEDDGPNVFGISLAKGSSISSLFNCQLGTDVDVRLKTESLALAYMKTTLSSLGFDVLVAAILGKQEKPYRTRLIADLPFADLKRTWTQLPVH